MTHRYWQGAPPSEDLEALQEYFRPAGDFEVSDSFYPQAADLITDTDRPLTPPTGPSIFEEAGLDREEFLQLALQEPDIWDDGELDEIMEACAGSGDEKRLEFLAREFLTGYRTQQLPPRDQPRRAQTEEEIREELGLENEDVDLSPDGGSTSILSMEPGEGEIDVGDWWISKDKKG